MLDIIAIVAVVLAIAIAAVLILAATKPDTFQVQRAHQHQGAGGPDISADQRFSPMAQLVALREQGSRDMKRTLAAPTAARARSMPGTATRMSAPAAWRSSKPRALEDRHQARFLQAVRRPQHRRIHNGAAGRCYPSDLDDDRARRVPVQGDAGVHESGPHDRQGFRDWSCQSEEAHREVAHVHRKFVHAKSVHPRSQRCRSIPICSSTETARKH